MGPKKEGVKNENSGETISIEDSVNTENWKCVVVMAVEKSAFDGFVLKEFTKEASSGRRREVSVIDYEKFVLKILNDFSKGEIPYKYSFLTKFSPIFKEAAEYSKNKVLIPVLLLAKIVKALLFFLREESIKNIEKKKSGPQDPVKAMAERASNSEPGPKGNPQKKDESAPPRILQDGGTRIRPPSQSKEDTKLLKRGEGAKEIQCIDDAPLDAFFKMYVLLSGFYHPDFPMELIKAQVPLHGVLCIDTALSGVKRIDSPTYGTNQKKSIQPKSSEIESFWDEFLNILWNPQSVPYFKEVIFQVYSPRKLACDKKKLREFIYKEISYLMYDISDYKRLHGIYLNNLKLWNVEENDDETNIKERFALDNLSADHATVPVILSHILNAVSAHVGDESKPPNRRGLSTDSIDSDTIRTDPSQLLNISESVIGNRGSSIASPPWSRIIMESGRASVLNLYAAMNDLDFKYFFKGRTQTFPYPYGALRIREEEDGNCGYSDVARSACRKTGKTEMENADDAALSERGIFSFCRKEMSNNDTLENKYRPFELDYCLYLFLMSKIVCPHRFSISTPKSVLGSFSKSNLSMTDSDFETTDHDSKEEMQMPHSTATECSRTVLGRIPCNLKNSNRHFFRPEALKVISAQQMRARSAPEVRVSPRFPQEVSFFSDFAVPEQAMNRIEWDVYENLHDFLGRNIFPDTNGFDFIEELSKPKLLVKEKQYSEDFICVDYGRSVLTDSLLVIIHNKKNLENSYQEIFNAKLKTKIGLRDFFEYVLDDERQWFESQAEITKKNDFSEAKSTLTNENGSNDFEDSVFWMFNSIKFGKFSKDSVEFSRREVIKKGGECSDNTCHSNPEPATEEGLMEKDRPSSLSCFEGYDVDDLAVQFSGLKTTYFAEDSSMTVNLTERLYGKQELGISVRQGGHSLHFHSYVCPFPHVPDPFTFHLIHENGTILAFGKTTFAEEESEPKRVSTSNGTDLKTSENKLENCSRWREYEVFAYDLKLSLPNGLTLEVLRNSVKPCHIRQRFLSGSCGTERKAEERSRLYLPNGTLIKVMHDGKFQVLKANAFILNYFQDEFASFSDKYEMTSTEGVKTTVDRGRVISSETLRVFENVDLESGRRFFRRDDGLRYVIETNGTLCAEFADGTKMCHTPIMIEKSRSSADENHEKRGKAYSDSDSESDFVFVYEEIIIENADYATVIYTSLHDCWNVILPGGPEIRIDKTGNYSVHIDKKTELETEKETIKMNRFYEEDGRRILSSSVKIDLRVFQKPIDPSGTYCKMECRSGETFVVQADSKNYCLPAKKEFIRKESSDSRQSKGGKRRFFSRDHKYLVIRKDMTGFEIVHREDFEKILKEIEDGSVVHTREIDGQRCFIIISPLSKEKNFCETWLTDSILSDPNFGAEKNKRETSSTYGRPPTWMNPFPKRKPEFQVPGLLTCRVFVESRRTDLFPPKGKFECVFCKVPDLTQARILPEARTVREYVDAFRENDQILLREAYLTTVWEMVNEKRKARISDAEKFKRCLTLLENDIESEKHHKKTIRFREIPNYFHQGKGFFWLLVNGLIGGEKFGDGRLRDRVLPDVKPASPPESVSTFSNEEIEYDLTWTPARSFSDLSYLTNASSKTAPPVLIQEFTTRQLSETRKRRNAVSAPAIVAADFAGSTSSEDGDAGRRLCTLETDGNESIMTRSFLDVGLEGLLLLGLV